MEVSSELKKLAEKFLKNDYSLYIVGGYVRDSLLGKSPKDIDITSNMPYTDVIKIAKELKFKTTIINKNLGTIQIRTGSEEYEYTQFRKESYAKSGKHSPSEVVFVDDILEDCRRRDLSINAIYYDILNDEIVDPSGGINNLNRKLIKTPVDAKITLSDDGLRILRLIRFASTYNFKFEKNTYKAMSLFRTNLREISKERILKELELLTRSDLKFENYNHIFLKTIQKLNLLELIFNHSLSRIKKFNKSDIKNFYSLGYHSRLIGFYILVIKNYLNSFTNETQLAYNINMLLGRDGIKESKDTINLTEKIYRIYQNIYNNIDMLNATINYLTLSDSERNIIDTYINKKAKLLLSDKISFIKSNNLPLSVHDLDITAQDLIDNGINKIFISKILTTMFNQVINLSLANEKEVLINFAKDLDKNFKPLTKE